MKIVISGETKTQAYELPDSYDLVFGDAEVMTENRFDTVGRINNVGSDFSLKSIRDDFDGLTKLKVTLYAEEVPVYTQSFGHFVYTISSASREAGFVESLFFAS